MTEKDKVRGRALLVAGYGGHAGYTYAVASELCRAGYKGSIILVAEGFNHIAEKFRGLGSVYLQVLPRRPGEPLYRGLNRWAVSFWQSAKLAIRHTIKVVFASGSNFSIPPSLTSMLIRRAKVYTLEAIERFTTPSRSTKALERLGSGIFLHWEEQREMFPNGIVVGPVYEPPIYEPRDGGYILVTTGTMGFKELFDSVEALRLDNVVVQTGDVDPTPYKARNPSWTVFRYTSDIHKWIAGASLVITQQGLTASIAAIAYSKPTVIVWNPRVVLGAPRRDVRVYAEKIGATYLEDCTPQRLREAIERGGKPGVKYSNGATLIAKTLLESLARAG